MFEAWFGWPALGLFSLAMIVPVCLALLLLARRPIATEALPGNSVSSNGVGSSGAKKVSAGSIDDNIDDSIDELAGASGPQANLALFQQKRREWQLQLEQGELADSAYQELLAESRQQLLAELDALSTPAPGEQNVPADSTPLSTATRATSLFLQRALLAGAAVLIPLLAYLLYLPAGYSLGAADQQAVVARLELLQSAADPDARRSAVQQLLEELERQTRSLAPDPQLLRLHAEVLLSTGRYQQSMRVYQRMLERAPNNAGIIAQLAEADYLQASANQPGNGSPARFSKRASELLDRALALDPEQPRALGLAGIRAFERQQWQQAIQWWQRAAAVYPHGSQQRAMVDSGIVAARARLAVGNSGAAGGNLESTVAGAGHRVPTGQAQPAEHFVKLAISIDTAQLRASDTASTPVFVFARPADGSRMPLAAKRLQLGDLPTTIVLTASDKMAGRSIADVEQVVVGARLARSGQPIAAAGDIESAALTVAVQRGDESGDVGGAESGAESGDQFAQNTQQRIDAAPLHHLRIQRSSD